MPIALKYCTAGILCLLVLGAAPVAFAAGPPTAPTAWQGLSSLWQSVLSRFVGGAASADREVRGEQGAAAEPSGPAASRGPAIWEKDGPCTDPDGCPKGTGAAIESRGREDRRIQID